jgi:hypothetical protein
MKTERILSSQELSEIFGSDFAFYLNIVEVVINTKNVNKAEKLMNNGYSALEIKSILPYQNWL